MVEVGKLLCSWKVPLGLRMPAPVGKLMEMLVHKQFAEKIFCWTDAHLGYTFREYS